MVPAPKLCIPTQGAIMSLHCDCSRCLCYVIIEKSVNLLTHTLCPTVKGANRYFLPFKSYPADGMLENFVGIWTNLKEGVFAVFL